MFLVAAMVVIALFVLVCMPLLPWLILTKCQRMTLALIQVDMGG
jgi:hypothetical protein